MNAPNYNQIESIVQSLVGKINKAEGELKYIIPTQYNSIDTDSETGLLEKVAEGAELYNHMAIAGINVLIDKINDLTQRVSALEKAASTETAETTTA